MGQIYSIARHTIIYLGNSTPVIDAAFQHAVESENPVSFDKDQHHDAPEDLQIQLVAREILDRPWFTRICVFQELVLSRDPWVQCGSSRLKWRTFCSAFLHASVVEGAKYAPAIFHSDHIVPEHHNSKFELLRSLDGVRTTYRIDTVERRSPSELTLVALVTSRRGLGVTDPRDTIYGHMGLVGLPAQWMELRGVEFLLKAAEYEKSVAEVFMDFAHDMIEWSGHFWICSDKETLPLSERLPNMASWAPDWSVHPLKQPQTMGTRGAKWYQGEMLYPYRRYSWVPNSRLLLISAETISPNGSHKILEVSRVIPWDSSDIIVLGHDQSSFATDLGSFLDSYFREESREDEWRLRLYQETYGHYSETLGHQFLPEIESKSAFNQFEDLRAMANAPEGRGDRIKIDSTMLSELFFAHTFQIKERSILAGRRLALLEGGNIGLVPPTAQPGDIIYQLGRDLTGEWDSMFVFRPLSRDDAHNSARLLTLSQLKVLDNFKNNIEQNSKGRISVSGSLMDREAFIKSSILSRFW